MKLGILTFHSQLNYGGVLQCWALKTALEQMGHSVTVIDHWHDLENRSLLREFVDLNGKGWMKLIVRGLLGCGDFGKLMRTIRTIRFVRGLGLSKEHFCQWNEIEQSNNQMIGQLDLLVVGSDQVWHCGNWGDPRAYLLEGAPKMRAISYAASFGLKELPADMVDLYKRGLARFSALSCREREGVEICRSLGFEATHVVDPTLLVNPAQWYGFANRSIEQSRQSNNRTLVCYFMSIDLKSALPELERFACEHKCLVKVLVNEASGFQPFPHSAWQLAQNFKSRRVRLCRESGPKEFVRAFSEATWTLTDSFHAVMFSSIFGCNLRFLKPSSRSRARMFSRIEEFAAKVVRGPWLSDSVSEALVSFARGGRVDFDQELISLMREGSKRWLAEHCMSAHDT